jgi:hypothetical protein
MWMGPSGATHGNVEANARRLGRSSLPPKSAQAINRASSTMMIAPIAAVTTC